MKKILLLFTVFVFIFYHDSISQITKQNKENIIIQTKAQPKANFSVADSAICKGQHISFTDLSDSTVARIWYFEGGNPDTTNVRNPVVTYNTIGSFSVTLIAKNGSNTDTLFAPYLISVAECEENYVFIPNIFTPNEDGNNDILYVISPYIKEMYMIIYDRWGKKVFETNDIAVGWTGEIKGQKAEQGTYVYYIDVTFKNGEVRRIKGNFSLIR